MADVTTWHRGGILRFESMASFGAKYCEACEIGTSGFARLIMSYVRERERGHGHGRGQGLSGEPIRDAMGDSFSWQGCTIDEPRLDVPGLAKFLDEPLSILSTMSLRPFILDVGASLLLASKKDKGEEDFRSLWGCECCLAAGYHSVLHQVSWLKRCYIHGTPLVLVIEHCPPPVSGLRTDTRGISPLRELWFGKRARWPLGRLRALEQGELEIDARSRGAALAVQRVVSAIRLRATTGDKILNFRASQSTGEIATLVADIFGVCMPRWTRTTDRPKLRSRTTVQAFEPSELHAIRQFGLLGTHWFDRLCSARVLQCIWEDQFPAWRQTTIAASKQMRAGHELCADEFAAHAGNEPFWMGRTLLEKPIVLSIAEVCKVWRCLPCDRTLSLAMLVRRHQLPGPGHNWHSAEAFNGLAELAGEIFGSGWREQLVLSRLLRLVRAPSQEGMAVGETVRGVGVTDVVLDEKLSRVVMGVVPKVIAPSGRLAQLVDEVLLLRECAAIWAVYDCEGATRRDPYLGFAMRTYAEAFCARSPAYAMSMTSDAVLLRTWARAPSEHPPWTMKSRPSRVHRELERQMRARLARLMEGEKAAYHEAICIGTGEARPPTGAG